MKKLVLGLFTFLMVFSVNAQSPSQALKAARKALNGYVTDTDKDKKKASLDKAITNIDIAAKDPSAFEGKSLTKMWMLRGEIYNEIAQSDYDALQEDENYVSSRPEAALVAYEALTKAFDTAPKKYFKTDALNHLYVTATHLSNAGVTFYRMKNFDAAYNCYKNVLATKELLDANKGKKILDKENGMSDVLYMQGLSALNASKKDEAKKIFKTLAEKGYNNAGVYDSLFQLFKEDDLTTAEKYLSDGRAKFPQDNMLMVSELNHYLSTNRFDELVGKLKKAIEAEPENVSYYSALGNTYDNLFQKEMNEGNHEKAEEHFNNALSYYEQALEKDGTYFFAVYNSGVLYVNKANAYIEELKVLEDKGDYSKAGIRALEAKKGQIDSEFEKALPYFQKAEKLKPNDVNTLLALKEIYARKEDFDTSKEFKRRLDVIEAGGTNDKSYFDK